LRIRHLLRRGHCELNASDLADIITTEESKLTLIANVIELGKRRDVCSTRGRDGERKAVRDLTFEPPVANEHIRNRDRRQPRTNDPSLRPRNQSENRCHRQLQWHHMRIWADFGAQFSWLTFAFVTG
jgi:hypothetical protein